MFKQILSDPYPNEMFIFYEQWISVTLKNKKTMPQCLMDKDVTIKSWVSNTSVKKWISASVKKDKKCITKNVFHFLFIIAHDLI